MKTSSLRVPNGRGMLRLVLCSFVLGPWIWTSFASAQEQPDGVPVEEGANARPAPTEKTASPRAIPAPSPEATFLPSGLRAELAAQVSVEESDQAAPQAEAVGQPPNLHPLGLIVAPPSKPAAATAVLQQIRTEQSFLTGQKEGTPALSTPPAHDNSAGLPPIGDQGAQNSCASWATGYYLKSYQEAK